MFYSLLLKELRLELKNKSSIAGLFLYISSTIFLCYLAFNQNIDIKTYNTLFWIIVLFTSVNSTSKSFMQENDERKFYYFLTNKPTDFIFAKITYNVLFLTTLALISLSLFIILMGNPIKNTVLFLIGLTLGSFSIASTMSLISAIGSKSGNNPTLVSILGFPIILPILMATIKISEQAMLGNSITENNGLILALSGLSVVVLALSYLLFPYLWRD